MTRVLAAAMVAWAVPIVTRILVQTHYSGRGVGAALGSAAADLFRPGYNLFLVGVLSAAPLLVLAALSEAARRGLTRVYRDPAHRTALAALAGVLVLATAAASLLVWRDVYGPGPHSSTAVIALVTMPVFLAVCATFLYLGVLLLVGLRRRPPEVT